MKKILILFLLPIYTMTSQVVNIPDANFKAKLIQQGVDTNGDGEIQASEAQIVSTLSLSNSNISDLTGISAFTMLFHLSCSNNSISVLDLSGLNNLDGVYVDYNQLTVLNLTGCNNLNNLICNNNLLTSLDIPGFAGTGQIICEYNQLTSLNIYGNPSILYCRNNNLTVLNITGKSALQQLHCDYNALTGLDMSGCVNLLLVDCTYNQITSFVFPSPSQVDLLDCQHNLLTDLDLSGQPYISTLNCAFNQLQTLNIKNGQSSPPPIIVGNPNLAFICCDPQEQSTVEQVAPGVNINSYCTFVPGGSYNTITGTQKFDIDGNGCNSNDSTFPFFKLKINNGTQSSWSYTSTAGSYKYYAQTGNFTLSAQCENQAWFNISPASATVNFPSLNNSVSVNNFCVTANGSHPDLEVVIAPMIPARPGFEAVYKIVYRNKGNQPMPQVATSLAYDADKISFFSTNTPNMINSPGLLTWSDTNLLPFESRSIVVTLLINTPTDALNPVNIGDTLEFTTSVNPTSGDENVQDNTMQFHQMVVGSFDPNDIYCVEGETVPASEIGKYLHYIINFENTGNYPAENIVVKEVIDTTKFDISSLQFLNSSHPVDVRVHDNIAEMIFQGINLETGGHGNVMLKIKTKDGLVAGDMVSKDAKIYFDYNAPVATNMANTIFAALSVPGAVKDTSISVFPVPSSGFVTVRADNPITSLEVYDISGRLLEVLKQNANELKLDLSGRASGTYFLRIQTENGMSIERAVKK